MKEPSVELAAWPVILFDAECILIVPRFLRDPVYGWIARNRYRLFGRRQTCWMAPPEYKERML